MSISDEIRRHVENGVLIPVIPKMGFGSQHPRRYIFLTDVLNQAIEREIDEGDLQFAELEADFVYFEFVKHVERDFFKQLRPPTDGVWEIRSYRIDPTIRVFGQFASKNYFIATSFRYRHDLAEFTNDEWKHEKRKTIQSYRRLFPHYPAKTTSNAYKLFDGALYEKYYDD